MSREEAKAYLAEMFRTVFNPPADVAARDRFFASDYRAISNGVTLDRAAFEDHWEVLQSQIRSLAFRFEDVMTTPGRIATILTFDVVQNDGAASRIRSHAFYTLRGEQIVELQEVTHLLEGREEDADLASRTSG